ncbi:MAG: hypothetical protein IT447_14935 [Phycisphaerales bacterium]|jgi:diphthamide biosynthesis methyltransferase|nr:hypothetical protein [Phycisphaerales bacterium]
MEQAPVLALVRDLLFASKITAEAGAKGVKVKIIRNPAVLANEAGRLLLVDLNLPDAITAAVEWKNQHNGPAIGFVSHTDVDAIQQAKSAGLDKIVSRGQFVQQLPDLLTNAQ